VASTYGILVDLDQVTPFCQAVSTSRDLRIAFIVTDDDRRFQAVIQRLPDSVEPVRLYESYLANFQFANGA
jgi:adenine-specific DNA-methyltransferase